MQIQHRQINVVQQLCVILDARARAQEDDNLLLLVEPLQEAEEEEEPLVCLTYDVALLESVGCGGFGVVVDVDVEWAGLEGDAGEVFDLSGLGCREEEGLARFLGENLDNLLHFILETHLQDAVSLIEDEHLHVLEHKAGGVLQMIQKTAGSRNEQIHTLVELVRFLTPIGATNDNTEGLRVMGEELTGNSKNLEGELAGWGNDHAASAVAGLEAEGGKHLDGGDEEGEGLAGAGFRCAEDLFISASCP